MGRPTKWKPEYAEMARYACERLGATDEDMAGLFGVSERTIANWRAERPEFLQAIAEGKLRHDTRRVERRLLDLALGYYYPVQRWDAGRVNPDDTTGAVVQLWHYKHADVRAIALWMHNRQGWQLPAGGREPAAGHALPPGVVAEEDGRLAIAARRFLEEQYGTVVHVESTEVSESDGPGDHDGQEPTD